MDRDGPYIDMTGEATPAPPARGKVYLDADAFKSIILFAKRYASENIPEHEWKEVYGFLVGRVQGDDVRVDAATPMTSGEATEVVFDASHYSKAWQLDNEIADREDGTFVCGWWHSHPFKNNPDSIFLSSIDVANHLGFQGPNPLAIALVHDPSKVKSKEIPFGMKVFRLAHADFTMDDLHRFALDLTARGTTRSDPGEVVYHEVPFEVVGLTPEVFSETLVDVYEKTVTGAPPVKAYLEDEPATPSRPAPRAGAVAVGRSPGAGDDEVDLAGDAWPVDDIPTGPPPTLVVSLPEEMESINRAHVLPLDDFHAMDPDAATPEADVFYEKGINLKASGKHAAAIQDLERARRVYSKLDAPARCAFITNEIMECHFWAGHDDDTLIASGKLVTLGEQAGKFYFMGNAREFEGRAHARKGNEKEAGGAFQEARILFDKAGYHAKAGACAEMMGRLMYAGRSPDFERAAMFLAKALAAYRHAIDETNIIEPAWARSGFLQGHAALLEKLVREMALRLEDRAVARKVTGELDALGGWP